MFAGAAREAVFGDPTMIQRVQSDAVPVSVMASRMDLPLPGPEGQVMAGLRRTRPAPQGIAALDPSGRPLLWALSFDDAGAAQAFVTRAAERVANGGGGPVERWMRFPSARLADAPAESALDLPTAHVDERCLAQRTPPTGALRVRAWGGLVERPQGALRQEAYVEDATFVTAETQAGLAAASRTAGETAFDVPLPFARALASRAYLGMLDVAPFDGPGGGGSGEVALRAQVSARYGPRLTLRFQGRSMGRASNPGRDDGARFDHTVELSWDGFVTIEGERVVDLALVARGTEALRWDPRVPPSELEIRRLPAGRHIQVQGQVAYGLVGAPVPEAECAAEDPAIDPAQVLGAALDRFRVAAETWQRSGRDPGPIVGPAVREVEALARRGAVAEAIARIDAAREQLEAEGSAPSPGSEGAPSPAPTPDDRLAGVRARFEALQRKVGELVRQGRFAEAEAALDRALRALEE